MDRCAESSPPKPFKTKNRTKACLLLAKQLPNASFRKEKTGKRKIKQPKASTESKAFKKNEVKKSWSCDRESKLSLQLKKKKSQQAKFCSTDTVCTWMNRVGLGGVKWLAWAMPAFWPTRVVEWRCFSGRWPMAAEARRPPPLGNWGAIFHHSGYLRSFHPPPHPFDPPRFPPANLLFKRLAEESGAFHCPVCADVQ